MHDRIGARLNRSEKRKAGHLRPALRKLERGGLGLRPETGSRDTLEFLRKPILFKRLRDHPLDARGSQGLSDVFGDVTRNHNDRDRELPPADDLEQIEATDSRHLEIEHHEIDITAFDRRKRFFRFFRCRCWIDNPGD